MGDFTSYIQVLYGRQENIDCFHQQQFSMSQPGREPDLGILDPLLASNVLLKIVNTPSFQLNYITWAEVIFLFEP